MTLVISKTHPEDTVTLSQMEDLLAWMAQHDDTVEDYHYYQLGSWGDAEWVTEAALDNYCLYKAERA